MNNTASNACTEGCNTALTTYQVVSGGEMVVFGSKG
jgi:hypothetical protein